MSVSNNNVDSQTRCYTTWWNVLGSESAIPPEPREKTAMQHSTTRRNCRRIFNHWWEYHFVNWQKRHLLWPHRKATVGYASAVTKTCRNLAASDVNTAGILRGSTTRPRRFVWNSTGCMGRVQENNPPQRPLPSWVRVWGGAIPLSRKKTEFCNGVFWWILNCIFVSVVARKKCWIFCLK